MNDEMNGKEHSWMTPYKVDKRKGMNAMSDKEHILA